MITYEKHCYSFIAIAKNTLRLLFFIPFSEFNNENIFV